jgi:hypothetical protein
MFVGIIELSFMHVSYILGSPLINLGLFRPVIWIKSIMKHTPDNNNDDNKDNKPRDMIFDR